MESDPSKPLSSDEEYYNLGAFHRKINTSNNHTQIWFNRGLAWSYGFNHEESAICFQNAIDNDPSCAIAYWGLAYALGPNYNKPWSSFDHQELKSTVERTHHAITRADENIATASPTEKALIRALRYRYQEPSVDDTEEGSTWNHDYAREMRYLYQGRPKDFDVAALYADALMNLTPWALWNLKKEIPAAGARTYKIQEVLECAMKLDGGDKHPGLLHLYIHLMEMSGKPEMALNAADALRGLVPDSGHLQHMPSHIDILCGDYRRAIASNSDAIVADEKYLARAGPLNFYTLYRSHNYHFRIYGAMFAGQSKVALDTVSQLEATITEDLLRVKSPPMADWLEGFLSIRIHVLIRFGCWEDLLALEFPADKELYCVTTAMIHYGKGIAHAVRGNIPEAIAERKNFKQAVTSVPSSRTLFNNSCLDILAIARSMLAGEIEYRIKCYNGAFKRLKQSTELYDNLPFDEPWGWMQPPRHAYAALLLEQSRIKEAAAMYSADLGFDNTLPRAHQHPNNVWSLRGYYECLVRLNRVGEASIVKQLLGVASAVADVPIKSSCFCRLDGDLE